jgi:glycosyltransferase involved in cell wall biosynthesis
MKIIIDYRNTYKSQNALRTFTDEFWRDITILHPGHEFIFLTAGKKTVTPWAENVRFHPLLKMPVQWLERTRLKRLLAALEADRMVVLQENTFAYNIYLCDKKSNKLAALPDKQLLFTGSTATSAPATPVCIPPALTDIITSLSWAEAESIKTQYTGGRSFFLFSGDISEQHQLIELLKAFSAFKKWQQSNMQLVIAGSTTAWTDMLEEKLQLYKYRQDVVLLKNSSTEVTAKLVAACYAMLYPVKGPVFPLALLWALQSHKAIIATASETNRQLTSAAAWVAENETATGFAKAMILLYKDESQQLLLVQQAKEQALLFNRRQMLSAAWQQIEQ